MSAAEATRDEHEEAERLSVFHEALLAACIPYWHLGAISRDEWLERIDAIAVPREHGSAK